MQIIDQFGDMSFTCLFQDILAMGINRMFAKK